MENVRITFTHLNGSPLATPYIVPPDDISGAAGSNFTLALAPDTDGVVQTGYSQTITFYGATFAFIKQHLILAPVPHLATIDVDVMDMCCSVLLFRGTILGSAVKWCEQNTGFDCSCEVSFKEKTEQTEAVRCLRETMIWERRPKKNNPSQTTNGEDEGRRAPYLNYCIELRPDLLQVFLMVFASMFMGLAAVVSIVITLVNGVIDLVYLLQQALAAVINAINTIIIDPINAFLTSVGAAPLDHLQGSNVNQPNHIPDYGVTGLQNFAVGCGYHHKAPFVASYLRNGCAVCGLDFESSLFQTGGFLENLTRLDASVKAAEVRQFEVPVGTLAGYIENAYNDNKPNINTLQLLQSLADFNMAWWVLPNGTGGLKLVVERKDWTPTNNHWLDVFALDPENVLSQCYSNDEKIPPAFGIYDYQSDGVDGRGDVVRKRWTDSVTDWNTPPNFGQQGVYDKKLPYSAALFRTDKNRDDVSPLDGFAAITNIWDFYFGAVLIPNQSAMLIEKHTFLSPKMLIYDSDSDIDDARVERIYDNSDGLQWYNYRMYIKPNFAPLGVPRPNIYTELYVIDDPRSPNYLKGKTVEVRITYDCDICQTMQVGKTIGIKYNGTPTLATVTEISINPDATELTITAKL
jgi:hypothetical protein